MQLSYQGGDARVPMVNYKTGQPGVLPYAIGVMDNIIARGATQSGLGALTNGTGVPYKSDYNNISVNAEGQALLSELRNSDLGLDTYGATEGSVAEMNAYQYQLATTQSESVTESTPLGFETAGAMFTGAINIRPDLNLGYMLIIYIKYLWVEYEVYWLWTEPSAAIYECCLSTEYAITA